MLNELHQLIAEGPIKCYDMISSNWVITKDGYLYIIDTDGKCIPKTIEKQLFNETSWFLLGDIIQGSYMNRRINYPWQLLVRGCYRYSSNVSQQIRSLFDKDVKDRLTSYNYYQQVACTILNCEWPIFIDGSFDVNNIAIQLATGLYLCNLNDKFKDALIADAHLLKNIICQVQARAYDEFETSIVPPITQYEIDDFGKYLEIAKQVREPHIS